MADPYPRYRLLPRGGPRSGWAAEWVPFLLALIAGAGLLFVLARHSPVFTVPEALPASGAIQAGEGGGHSGAKAQHGSADQVQ